MRKLKVAIFGLFYLFTGVIGYATQIPVFQVKEVPPKSPANRPFFFKPTFIHFDGGEIFVAESGDGQIMVYRPDGQLRIAIGKKGDGPDEFAGLGGLDVFEDKIYAADSYNKVIKIFNRNGQYLGGIKLPIIPVQIAVLDKDHLLITRRPTLPFESEPLVYCFDSKGQQRWKAINSIRAEDSIRYTLINEILIRKEGNEEVYIIWKNQNKSIQKINKHGQLVKKITLDDNYPVKNIKLPLKSRSNVLTMVIWNGSFYGGKFYFIVPDYTSDGDLGPGKEVMVVSLEGRITGVIKFPRPVRHLTVQEQFIYLIDDEGELRIYQLEAK